MQAIGNLLKSNPNGMSFEEIAKETLDDPDIKEWVSDMDGVVDAGMIERGMGVLREYIKNKDNPTHRPVLQVYANNILVTYVLRSEALVLKYRDKVPSRLVYDRTTKKYKGVELSDYETDMSNIKFFEYCKDFIDTYSYGDGSKGMWLHGKFGVGKTYLMAGLATELKKKQVGVTFVSASQLMDDMYLIIKDNQNNIQREIEKLSKAEVLIIDDLGTENPTKFMLKNVLYPIMKYRGEYKKPTFVTSNLTKDQYYMQLNEGKEVIRMDIARLKEQLDVLMLELNMGGINRRDKA